MTKKVIFIGDDHATDGCIHFGLQMLGPIKPNSYILLLEEEVSDEPITKNEFESVKATVLKDKQNGADSNALKILMQNAYAIYGFDVDGAQDSVPRHDTQKDNIAAYVTQFKKNENIESFIVIVGDAHLKTKYVPWTPLQESSYGNGTENMYLAALCLYAT